MPDPFRLGVSTFIVQRWLMPEDVTALAEGPIACVEVPAPGNFDPAPPSQAVRASVGALRASRLEPWSVHSAFGHGLDLSSLDETVRRQSLDAIGQAFGLAGELGCGAVVVHPSAEPITPEERPARLAQARRSLQEVVRFAEQAGVPGAMEPLPRTCLGNTISEMAALLADLPAERMGICLDVNHANVGQSLVDFVERFGSRIITLHISDNDGVDEKHWLPGEGVIDWPAVIGALRGVGYSGPWMYEVGLGGQSLPDRLRQFAANREALLTSRH